MPLPLFPVVTDGDDWLDALFVDDWLEAVDESLEPVADVLVVAEVDDEVLPAYEAAAT